MMRANRSHCTLRTARTGAGFVHAGTAARGVESRTLAVYSERIMVSMDDGLRCNDCMHMPCQIRYRYRK